MKAEARKYVRAFTNAVQPVIINMSDGDEHVLRACSLLLIPPPPPGTKYRIKSMPMSLAEKATPEWTKLVQDLASQMEALPRGFSVTEQQMSSLLAKLERATGHPSCDTCRYPRRRCICASEDSAPMPHESWSERTDSSSTYHQEYPLLTRGTTTVSISQSKAPATTATAPPQGVVSPVRRQPTMEVQGTTHQPFLGGSVNYASASLPRATSGSLVLGSLVQGHCNTHHKSLQPWTLLLLEHQYCQDNHGRHDPPCHISFLPELLIR